MHKGERMKTPRKEVDGRQKKILALVREKKRMTMAELQEIIPLSESTIRRDLRKLEKDGFLLRTSGEIIPRTGSEYEVNIYERSGKMAKEKQGIASKAFSLIQPRDIIFIGDGSTTFELAKLLLHANFELFVVTNSITVAHQLFSNRNIDLQVVGGSVRNATASTSGTKSVEFLRDMNFDKCFLGADSISLEYGITTPNYYSVMTEVTVIRKSKLRYILADSSKFDKVSFTPLIQLKEITSIITDHGAPAKYCNKTTGQPPQILFFDE